MYLEYARVKNVLEVDTKYGRRLVMNVKLQDKSDAAIWSEDLNNQSLLSKKAGDNVRLLKGTRGSYTIVEDETSNVNNHRNTLPTQSSYQSNRNASSLRSEGNGHSTPVNHQEVIEDLIHDVPMLSDLDKKKVAAFIDQQAKLYRYTVDTVAKQFPELVGVDDRGIRSIALSLLINTNHMINRNL